MLRNIKRYSFLKTDSMAKISISCSVSSDINPFLYFDTISLPILLEITTNLRKLSDSNILVAKAIQLIYRIPFSMSIFSDVFI